ncbi:hypothetical protein ACFFH2_14405 [Enterococcus devriesei]|uniref:Uncharacterized protein n=1 Tax=Enterococcus devriesei TaxID=319970 RepID=A0A1L8SWK5_9ENTE|nr:hypothetical protein [Enterococcus devriesei]MDT2821209.1 hypothetical protein [Enterococcus devriesei]MDU6523933.1 hypothetical protein [Enterococcus sp.]OJG36467.1 hypothetical protein RV00_GL001826 [Enterococcus devriesei]
MKKIEKVVEAVPATESSPKEFIMLQPHRHQQFHCEDVHRKINVNDRHTAVSLHVPPGFKKK